MEPVGVGQQLGCPVVALVASAGGLAALTMVLGRLPGDLDAAVIVIQHQDPHADDLLAHVLQPHTTLVVRPAQDDLPLRPGVVHLPPAGRHLLVTAERRLLLIEAGQTPPARPSADLLLITLALAAGPDAIAVVLSGRGNDGATGATAVHRCGGVVIAATGEGSAHTGMPRATADRDDITDHVTEPGDIAALLVRIVAARRRASPRVAANEVTVA